MSLYPISSAIGQESQESNAVPLEKAPLCNAETYAAGAYSLADDTSVDDTSADGASAVAQAPLYATLFPAASAWNKAAAFFGGVAAAAGLAATELAMLPVSWLSKPDTVLKRTETLLQERDFEALNTLVEQIDGYEAEMRADGQGQAAQDWRATINALVIRYENLWRHSLSELPQGVKRFVARAFAQQSLEQTLAISERRLDMALKVGSQVDLSALSPQQQLWYHADLAVAHAEYAVYNQDCRVMRAMILQLAALADTARQLDAREIKRGLELEIRWLLGKYETWQEVNLDRAGRMLSLANTAPLTSLNKRYYANAILAAEMADEPKEVAAMKLRYEAALRVREEGFVAVEAVPGRATDAEPVYIGDATALMQPTRLGSLFETLKRVPHRSPAAQAMYLELARLLGDYPDLLVASLDYQIRICVDEEAQDAFRARMGREGWTPAQTAYALAEAYTRGRHPTLAFGNGHGSDLRKTVLKRMDALDRPERDPRAEGKAERKGPGSPEGKGR